jgi:hypothetical protein
MQLKRTDFLDRIPKENQVEIPISAERLENEVDDWTRFVGTFAGWAAMNDFCGPAHFWIQQCCLGNAPRGLYQGWESIVTADKDGFKINLLLNRSTPEIDVDSYLPYEGKVEVNVKADMKLKLRIPGWVDLRAVKASVDGKDVLSQYDGRYIKFGSVSKGSTIVVTFPVTEQKVTYNIACPAWCSKYSMTDIYSGSGMPQPKSVYDVPEDIVKKILTPEPYTALFRGNTIVDMKPEGTIYPLYRREYMRESSAPMRKVERNIPDKLVHNWY